MSSGEIVKELSIHLDKDFALSKVELDGCIFPVTEIVIRSSFDACEITLTLDSRSLQQLEVDGEFLDGEPLVNVIVSSGEK